jgi:hypothetical protein
MQQNDAAGNIFICYTLLNCKSSFMGARESCRLIVVFYPQGHISPDRHPMCHRYKPSLDHAQESEDDGPLQD